MRDLGRAELWQESLERSLARRGKLPREATGTIPPGPASEPVEAVQPRPAGEPVEAVQPRPAGEPVEARRGRRQSFRTSGRDRAASRRSFRTSGRDSADRRQSVLIAGTIDRDREARRHFRRKTNAARRWKTLLIVAGGLGTLALLAATLPSLFAGGGASASAPATQVNALRAPATPLRSDAPHPNPGFGLATGMARKCPLVVQPSEYVNPLARAHVMPERIDQGVDYAGSGSVAAIGLAKVTYVATDGTGWPGTFIEYRLLDGADSGCYVYYAEGVTPARGLHVGQRVRAGQAIATIIPFYETGIEIGWAAGSSTTTYAAKAKQWTPTDDADNIPTPAGASFSALIAALGGPPGKTEGGPRPPGSGGRRSGTRRARPPR